METKGNKKDVLVYNIVDKNTQIAVFSYAFIKKYFEDWQADNLLKDFCEINGLNFRNYEIKFLKETAI